MGLDRAQNHLCDELARLGDCLRALELTLGDRPVTDGDALAERLSDSAVTLVGIGEEAAHVAAGRGEDLALLAHLHTLLLDLMRRFHGELAGTAILRALSQMAHRRGGEWTSWAQAVQASIDQGWTRLFAAITALAECLNELGERQRGSSAGLLSHPLQN